MPRTSAEIASLAARVLRDPSSATVEDIKDLAATALAQRREDFEKEEEVLLPVPDGRDIMDDLPKANDQVIDQGFNGEDATPIGPTELAAAEDISPKVLTDAFVEELRGVVVPTRKTAVRMSEFVVSYLHRLARDRSEP